MRHLSTCSIHIPRPPATIYDRWADPVTWHEWDPDVRQATLDTPTAAPGATGRLRPASGPPARFIITIAQENQRFVDESRLPGARLVFDHRVEPVPGGSRVTVEIGLRGALAPLWAVLMGGPMREAASRNVHGLASHLSDRAETSEGRSAGPTMGP